MDHHVDDFYQCLSDESPHGKFHDVIPLHRRADISWAEIAEKVPGITRGWYELARISSKDRIEFTFDNWCATMPYNPRTETALEGFFASLDDIGIYVVQKNWDDPYKVEMVYSLENNAGFYRGDLPASEAEILYLQKFFDKYILPADYLAFLQIHNGFWKTTDCSGIAKASHLPVKYDQFQELLAKEASVSTSKGEPVNPKSLIPFYESFGMPYYQCFWGEWYPEQEMGNVYYSSETKAIPSIANLNHDDLIAVLAFPTFADWLAFYLERIG